MTWQSEDYAAMPDEAYDSTGVLDESCKTGMMAKKYEGWFECLDGTHRTEACEYPFHSCALPQLTALHRFTSPPRGLRSHCVDPLLGPAWLQDIVLCGLFVCIEPVCAAVPALGCMLGRAIIIHPSATEEEKQLLLRDHQHRETMGTVGSLAVRWANALSLQERIKACPLSFGLGI